MIVKVYAKDTNPKTIAQIVSVLENDGVIIYPTDSLYAFGASLSSPKAIEKIKTIKAKKASELTIACADLSHIADYAKVDTPTFKILKRNLPGPFTFILKATPKMPSKALEGRKTIGVRIPDNKITLEIIKALGVPLITSTVHSDEIEYSTDPELIDERFGDVVDLVVDGGISELVSTALIDVSGDEIEILREGREEVLL